MKSITVKFKFDTDEDVASALNEAMYILSDFSSTDPKTISGPKVQEMSTKWITKWLEKVDQETTPDA